MQFPSRAEWADHEFLEHRTVESWICSECSESCGTELDWKQHLEKSHQRALLGPRYENAKKLAHVVRAKPTEDEECPLCQIVLGKPRREFIKHVARHMEEIALVVLPRDIDEDSEVQSTSTDLTNSVRSHDDQHELSSQMRPYTISRDGDNEGAESPNPEASVVTVMDINPILRHHRLTGQDNVKSNQTLQDDQSGLGKDDSKRSFNSQQIHFTRVIGNEPEKAVLRSLPTVRDHTTGQLTYEQDEYIPREYDEAGERKVSAAGEPLGNRKFNIRTFYLVGRGSKRFMLAIECARILGYRDSYLLFRKNYSLYKLMATQPQKDDLIHQEILPNSYRSRSIAFVTAKSIFRQFGARVIECGRRVRDDYWEAKAIKQGFTEEDMAGDKRPGATKERNAAAAAEQSRMQAYDHTLRQD